MVLSARAIRGICLCLSVACRVPVPHALSPMIRIPDTLAILLQTVVKLLQQILDTLTRIERAAFEIVRLLMQATDTNPQAGQPVNNHADSTISSLTPGRTDKFIVTVQAIEAGLWLPKEAAWRKLGISRDTMDRKLTAGKLTAYHKVGDEDKTMPRVWLSAAEVDRHYHEYTLMKGKE